MTKQPMRLAGLALVAGASLTAATAQAADKGTVHLAYVEWSDAVASTNVMRAVLEQAGYEVELTSLSAAAMWQSVATGDADAMTTAWLPTTHQDYHDRLEDQVVDLGVNLDGTKLGLVVPAYSEMNSIADLDDHADAIDGKITGIDPGAGLMGLTEEVIEEYDLDVDLQSGSGATMTAALQNAVANDEEIVVTGWTPHWKFARWDLKYLEDPKNVYGGAEQIHTMARQGLEEDMPEAYAILDAFEWTPEQMGEVQLLNQQEDADPYENAKQWVAENQDLVQEWLPES
ncbi:glycine betaine ABC transporter substrate-binding protein [Halomonas beimenensis]|uniref:Glycine betaine ABC transport system, glycine betaine-binding protein OpuAC n=1 Tax=Halomonas beimenensis TaxID=475662 RepID=A0A291PA51_9GAMM|nr:glycine betaine ABC transporter substrate-binding protein [Halomonas beimenensis]ATJ83741.1 glycine betaine ABC transport system, glycine betaine-binding protein OpuAC [Halomonas beimenensis]